MMNEIHSSSYERERELALVSPLSRTHVGDRGARLVNATGRARESPPPLALRQRGQPLCFFLENARVQALKKSFFKQDTQKAFSF